MLLVEADFIILENAMCDEAHWLHLPNHKNLEALVALLSRATGLGYL